MSKFYENTDMLIVGYLDLYNKTFSNNSIATTPYAMRISSEDGMVKWAKAAFVKNTSLSYECHSLEITNDQTAWFLIFVTSVTKIYRMDSNGSLLQVICFGQLNLAFGTTSAMLSMISDSDFMIAFDLSDTTGGFNAAPGTLADYSVARITTDLTVK